MAGANHSQDAVMRFNALFQKHLSNTTKADATIYQFEAPGVFDVMGGIGEYTGSLVLTAAATEKQKVAVWAGKANDVSISLLRVDGETETCRIPASIINDTSNNAPVELEKACAAAGGDWALPIFATIRQAIAMRRCPPIQSGIEILVGDGFDSNVDLGREYVQSVAVLRAVVGLVGGDAENLALAQVVSEALQPIFGAPCIRTALTALLAPPKGSLLQLRIQPQLLCDELNLPKDIVIRGVSTSLERPTTRQRMLETRICSSMGHRMILDLMRKDGLPVDPNQHRLSSITPQEYVERFRDRLPSKISRSDFIKKHGELNGLDGDGANPRGMYKVRSRAEHHIYENKRVHDFSTMISRARRTGDENILIEAGEFMYASHWSYSQRCGIGGVEADRLSKLVREYGPKAGFYGAKVTSGGAGGELVIMMREDDRSNEALEELRAKAAAEFQRDVLLHHPLAMPRQSTAADEERSDVSDAAPGEESSQISSSSIAASA